MHASHHDSLGNPVTLADPASLGPLNDFVEGFIACEARVVNVLSVAEADPSPLVQACCAALHMFAESGDAPRNAAPFIEAARRSTMQISEREQRFVEAVAAWVAGDMPRAIALHEEQAREHPRDLASIKLGQYHLFNLGNSPGMLRIALAALHAAAEVPYLHGMAAFGWEQCHLLEQAEAAARQRHRDAAEGALGAARAGARDADAGTHHRGAGLHACGERAVDRAEFVHGDAQLVAPGAVRAGA